MYVPVEDTGWPIAKLRALQKSGSEAFDILAVTHGMWKRGWMVAPNSQPPGIHFMITPVHAPVIEAYLAALGEAVSEVKAGHKPAEAVKPRYA